MRELVKGKWIIRFVLEVVLLRLIRLTCYTRSVKRAEQKFESVFKDFIKEVNISKNPRVLEIGSRVVTGMRHRNNFNGDMEYVGFDIHEGENVDIIGDAHKLASYFQNEKFDYVYSISVFEHLFMPWQVALEINKVLKPGGKVYLFTHPNYPLHETPWDFFRFSKYSFHSLFNKKTGFEIMQNEEGAAGRIVNISGDKIMENIHAHTLNYAVSVVAKKISEPQGNLNWEIDFPKIIGTMYPKWN